MKPRTPRNSYKRQEYFFRGLNLKKKKNGYSGFTIQSFLKIMNLTNKISSIEISSYYFTSIKL